MKHMSHIMSHGLLHLEIYFILKINFKYGAFEDFIFSKVKKNPVFSFQG